MMETRNEIREAEEGIEEAKYETEDVKDGIVEAKYEIEDVKEGIEEVLGGGASTIIDEDDADAGDAEMT